MRLAPFSDLHLEFQDSPGQLQWTPDFDETDKDDTILALAGDLWHGPLVFSWIERFQLHTKFKAIVLILGNHDFWGCDFDNLPDQMRDECSKFSNVHFLHNETKVIEGVRFIGTTLWTDFDKENPMNMVRWRHVMNDARFMGVTANDILDEHKRGVAALDDVFNEFDGKTVVMTHHVPSWVLIDERFRGGSSDSINSYYAANCDLHVADGKFNVWVFGHTHTPMMMKDETEGVTIVCNPRGYNAFGEVGFQPNLRIEL